jgi:glycosyltransferase involved in cell wall biosynthesis
VRPLSRPSGAVFELCRLVPHFISDSPVRIRRSGATIWLTWERHRRTRELSRELGLRLFEIESNLPRSLKYIPLLWKSAVLLFRERPQVLFIQCPSFVLGLWAAALKPVLRYTLVADLHTEAVEPFIVSFPCYRTLLRRIQRAADYCVVSNGALKEVVERTGGKALVLPDKLPALGAAAEAARPVPIVVFICTYSSDEPYRDVIEAARLVGPRIAVFITGDPHGFEPDRPLPPHVQLTGFLAEAAYEDLLRSADVVIDLTSAENCLVCGAYEAVALEKPLVTSDTRALREYFRLGTVYARHDAQSLAAAITYALAHKGRLTTEMRVLRRQLTDSWAAQRTALEHALRLETA